MKLHENIAPFGDAIQALQRLLEKFDNRGVIIGGIAVGLLGRPRYTADVDAMFLLSVEDIARFIDLANTEKIVPRIQNAAAFARDHRVLLLQYAPGEIAIDISLGILPFEEEVVERSIVQLMESISIRLPTPEDLIILKAVAHRPKDMMDIASIVENQPNLDFARIEYWVKAFADILELPDLWGQISKLLKG